MPGALRRDAPVRELPWAALDLEMTGLDPVHDRICEIGIVRGRWGGVEERWARLVCPGVPVSEAAQGVHGLDDEDLADAPAFDALAAELRARLEGTVCLAHRAEVDRAFLEAALARAGVPGPDVAWIDTLRIARRFLHMPRHRLADVAVALGVPHAQAHRALGDALATWGVFERMIDVLDPHGTLTLGELEELVDDLAAGSPWRERQWATLREAFEARRTVRIEYLSRDGGGRFHLTVREIEIWKLSPPRIEGWCRLRGAHRIFRVERMRSVLLAEATYDIPEFQARI